MTDGSNVPDKPLTVKCKLEHNSRRQKLTFQTARNCTYDGLKEKIRKHFQLTVPFQIQWEDDDHEQNYILDQSSLNEAINYYHSGDEGSVASGSVFTSRNSSRYLRITMEVEICVGYDGPSLSDTASLASRDEYSPEGSQISFSPGELSSSSQDDDAVTVSSKDMGSHQAPRQGKTDSSLIKKLWNSTSRSGSSSTPNRPLLKPSRSRIFNLTSRASTTEEGTARSSARDNMINGRSSGSPHDTERMYPDDPSAVFERLKLAEQRDHDYPHDRSHQAETKTWLQEQTTLQMRATLGVVPSTSEYSFSLNTDSPFSDPGTDILLEKNENGRYYYTYTGSGSSESAGDLEYEVVNPTQPVDEMGILHELLVPEEVTDCSECGRVLDQIKYTCTTCREKTPMSRAALAAAAAGIGKGKSRASPDYNGLAEYEWQEPNYPPRAHRTLCPSYNHSSSKPLPALPSTSPTQTIFGRSLGSQSTLVPSSSSGSLSPTARIGYELCAVCFEKVGLDHALPGGMDSPSSPTMPPTAQELSVARRSAPKRGEMRHAFLFQVWGFNGWEDIGEQEEAHRCSVCQSQLSRIRYKCGKCDNFTICQACYNEVHNVHPIHPFVERRVRPPLRRRSRSEGPDDDGTYDNGDEPSLKHPGVRCINCKQDIVGARFHCVDCTMIDIDICSNCETAGLPGNLDASDGGHDSSSHIMLKIPMPLNMNEVQHVSQRAHGLRHGRDRADLRGILPLMRSSPGSVSSISVGTVLLGDTGHDGVDIEEDYVHLQVCNSCGEPIVGERYQCLNCPSNPNSYNLCSDCEVKSYRVHDAMHMFLKLPRPVDIPGPLLSEFPVIPVLYRDPAGPTPGSPAAEISGDPAAYLRDLTHAFALCDRHMIRIVGKWYRCAYCAKDLCAECEALDTHDNTHVFLVFKAPVDMQAFRHFADLQNPTGTSPPVLRGDIYVPRHD